MGRRYRVIQSLPWIEGGEPPLFEGGRAVVYEPGQLVNIEDSEAANLYHKLEAVDDEGRKVLEAARAKAASGARAGSPGDLDALEVAFLELGLDDAKRRQGQTAELLEEMADRVELQREGHRVRANRHRGGEAKRGRRKCPRIYSWIVEQLGHNQQLTNEELAELFSEEDSHLYLSEGGRFTETVFGDDGDVKGERSVSRHGFDRYVTAARDELGILRAAPSRST